VLARHRAVRILGWLAAGLAIAATAFSRVELGVHWTSDVIASIVFVTGWLTAITVLLGSRLRRPAPAHDLDVTRGVKIAVRNTAEKEGTSPMGQPL
jgi:membrane-associated phospholipid phosphatase